MVSGEVTDAVRAAPEAVAVVIPVHNEQRLLPHCLRAVRRAAAAVPIPVRTIVVLDTCTDDSARRVPGWAHTVPIGARSVGAARAAGFDAAAAHFDHLDPHRVWYATTDADSVVPADWLTTQLEHARTADLVAGTVTVRWREHHPAVRAEYERRYRAVPGAHGHVHGANLGFRAACYHAAGGFALLPADEDVDLVARLRRAGARTIWAEHPPVLTGDRSDNRVDGGFGGYLRDLADATPDCA
ncbi:glycosyltransferase [Nocardia harenae]|uniref:glycosyltransferase n=1 Tax=Nocardia harenae TaxID=358707 RepID=UPI000832BD2B|nr:glycosyltransferase [Nocardia harenae]